MSRICSCTSSAARGFTLDYRYEDQARTGDHICYISDLRKIRAHFPEWELQYDVPRILDEIVTRFQHEANVLDRASA